MIKEIENRRSIRKYKRHEISKEIIEDIIYSAQCDSCSICPFSIEKVWEISRKSKLKTNTKK
ncbi:MAG: hypothetical protein BHV87_05105 [Clostridiales bacterium 36_14]|nr:MAG: hypothetical protein BHV87_05105 [Clostridiales bacterium 36_14]